MRRPSIIQIVQHLQPGGLENLVLDISQFSKKQTVIVSLEGNKEAALKKWPKLQKIQAQLYFFDKKQGIQGNLIARLYEFIKFAKPEVVHTHHIGPLIYGGIAAKAAGVMSIIHTEHDTWHLQDTRRRLLQNTVLKLVKPHLVADADKVSRELEQLFPQQKITTILNGIDTKRFIGRDKKIQRIKLQLPQDVVVIGSAGRLEKVKGHDLLISALCFLPENIHLAIAGHGNQRASLQTLAQKLEVIHRVHFVGHIDEMELFYPALDLFCLASRNEGYPLTALEAQACGIPTAVTDVGAAKETLCPKTGMLLLPNNIKAIAGSLSVMVESLNVSMENPRHFVCKQNDIAKMIVSYEKLAQPCIRD